MNKTLLSCLMVGSFLDWSTAVASRRDSLRDSLNDIEAVPYGGGVGAELSDNIGAELLNDVLAALPDDAALHVVDPTPVVPFNLSSRYDVLFDANGCVRAGVDIRPFLACVKNPRLMRNDSFVQLYNDAIIYTGLVSSESMSKSQKTRKHNLENTWKVKGRCNMAKVFVARLASFTQGRTLSEQEGGLSQGIVQAILKIQDSEIYAKSGTTERSAEARSLELVKPDFTLREGVSDRQFRVRRKTDIGLVFSLDMVLSLSRSALLLGRSIRYLRNGVNPSSAYTVYPAYNRLLELLSEVSCQDISSFDVRFLLVSSLFHARKRQQQLTPEQEQNASAVYALLETCGTYREPLPRVNPYL
ncbi:MAG: hypothetical protein LBJ89_02580 [Holosporales bacterium]|nr:hypothetical protein [Holosporales bacterium]